MLIILLLQLFGMVLLHLGQVLVIIPIFIGILPEILSRDGIDLIALRFELHIVILVDPLQSLKMFSFPLGLVLFELLDLGIF